MFLSDLQNKDIISVTSGNNLGRIVDVEVNSEGKVTKIVAEQRRFFLRIFKSQEIEFSFSDIEKIGIDVILIKK